MIKDKISKIIIFLLLLIVGVFWFQNYLLKRSTDKLIEDSNVLPPNVKQEIVVKQDKVTIKEKKTNKTTGEVSVSSNTHYIPPEGSLTVTTSEDGETNYKLTNKGFTFTPGITVIPSEVTDVGVNVRLLYYNRFGAGVGGVISIEDNPKPGFLGVVDYRFYKNFAIGVAYKEAFTTRKFGASLTYYF